MSFFLAILITRIRPDDIFAEYRYTLFPFLTVVVVMVIIPFDRGGKILSLLDCRCTAAHATLLLMTIHYYCSCFQAGELTWYPPPSQSAR